MEISSSLPLYLNPRTSTKSGNSNLPLNFAGPFQFIVADPYQSIQEKVTPIPRALIFVLISWWSVADVNFIIANPQYFIAW
jgi:hypothetical protein